LERKENPSFPYTTDWEHKCAIRKELWKAPADDHSQF
jgi:hypothetical protein